MSSDSSSNNNEDPSFHVVVVGGGVGGLATAARIASSFTTTGCRVTILEKNEQVGGRAGSFYVSLSQGRFRHERGPSLLLLPHVYRELFQDCGRGAKPEDFGLIMEPCIPAYQVVFDDGDRLNVGFPNSSSQEVQAMEQQSRHKMDQLESGGATKWDNYMRTMSAFLDCGLPNFIEERLDLISFPAFLMEALRYFGKSWPLKPHSDVLDATFESEKMKALASFQDLYVGLEPYRNNQQILGGVLETTAPAVFGLLAAIELHPTNKKAGVFAPVGGFQAVSESFENLAKACGVTIQTETMVTSIDENGVHVRRNGEDYFESADLIIVNADLPYATSSLLRQQSTAKEPKFDWDDKFLFSSGVIAFHWSLDKELVDLNTHNVFLAATKGRRQAEESWRVLRRDGKDFKTFDDKKSDDVEPCNFYVHRPSCTDSTAAPRGCDSLMILVPCPTLEKKAEYTTLSRDEAIQKYKEQFDDTYITKIRQAVLDRFAKIDSLAGLKNHILDEVVDTPGTYADYYHVGAGTPFALSHGFGQLSLTRPGPSHQMKSADSNVLFCGASSRPGNGVPLVLIGSKLVARKALAKLNSKNPQDTT